MSSAGMIKRDDASTLEDSPDRPGPPCDASRVLAVHATRLPVTPAFHGGCVEARHFRLWTDVAALHLNVRSEAAFEAEMRPAFPCLVFTMDALGGQVAVAPDRRAAAAAIHNRPGPLSMVPAGTPVFVQGRVRQFQQLMLQFDGAPDESIDLAAAFRPRFMFSDAGLSRLCLLLADECVSPSPMGRLYGDSLIISLLLALSRGKGCDPRSAGGLAPWQMLRLDSYVEAHLGEDLSLASLAREVGISRSHFSRSFRQTLGQSPFEWLRVKRIERAKRLLLEGALSVAEVAIATGFADQAHLTRAFGRIEGIPPGAWQRARRHGFA
jgi:AraC family transcriptional regulator